MRPRSVVGVLAGLTLAVFAGVPASSAEDTVPIKPTFTKDVLPIFQKACQGCHRPNTAAPMALVTYEDVRPWARAIKQQVESRSMPPWFSDRTVGEYLADPSLTDSEVATIGRWVEAGAPKGDMNAAPPPLTWPAADAWFFGEEPDLFMVSAPVTAQAVGRDTYPESEIPTGLTEDRYIKWIQIIPEQTKVVHHVIVSALQAEPGAQARSQTNLANFARGTIGGDRFADGDAKVMRKGAVIRFQQHLHPNGEQAITEHTKVGIKFYPKGYLPKHLVVTKTIQSQAAVAIPPGEPNARSDAYFVLPQPATLVSFQPHMHYRGKRMTLEAIGTDGRPELLSDINRFVPAWQLTYVYKHPPTFPKGTVLHVTAFHDNSAANRDNPDPHAFVGWGDRTVDEMAIGWTDLFYLSDEEYAAIAKDRRAGSGTR